MLSAQENELLCRVGPGTPMGELMRQYWLPAYASHDVEADGAPIRVRLLGENLLGLRTTSGRVGLVSDVCPHRCTSLFLGRNEEEGLRCVYHGWKFDVDGRCVDQPGEPEDNRFESRTFLRTSQTATTWTSPRPRKAPMLPLPRLPRPIAPMTIRSLAGARPLLARAVEVNTYGAATAAQVPLRN